VELFILIHAVQTVPGADTDCDHNLLVAKICNRLKKIVKKYTAIIL
jgi:hypothetical protein